MTDESDSDSDSDADDDDYETIYLECPAFTTHCFGHVVSDVSKSTSARVGSTAERTSSLADKPETETGKISGGRVTHSVESRGLRNFEQKNKDPVVAIWRSYNPEQEEPEPEVEDESDNVTQSVSLTLPCLEEVCSHLCFLFILFFMTTLLQKTSITF